MFIVKNPFAIIFLKEDFGDESKDFFNNFFNMRVHDQNAIFCDFGDGINPHNIWKKYSDADCAMDFIFFNIVVNLLSA